MRINRAALALCLLAMLCWGTSQAASTFPAPNYPVETVFIYSNGSVEKLLEKSDSWFLVEDMRKRRFKKEFNFTVPSLEFQGLTSGYRQLVSSGDPDALLPLGQKKHSSFVANRTRDDGSQLKQNWTCSPMTSERIQLLGQPTPVFRTECKRRKWIYLREEIELYYDPKSAWLVKTIRHKRGVSRTKELVAVLAPERATPLNIMRIMRKLRE